MNCSSADTLHKLSKCRQRSDVAIEMTETFEDNPDVHRPGGDQGSGNQQHDVRGRTLYYEMLALKGVDVQMNGERQATHVEIKIREGGIPIRLGEELAMKRGIRPDDWSERRLMLRRSERIRGPTSPLVSGVGACAIREGLLRQEPARSSGNRTFEPRCRRLPTCAGTPRPNRDWLDLRDTHTTPMTRAIVDPR